MIQLKNTIISLDVIEENFICNLSACKGACCIEGDSGAPLTEEEVKILETILPEVWDYLSDTAKKVISEQGVAYMDEDNEMVTSIINGKDCVFTYYDEKGICKCAIEKAFNEKQTGFIKPVSCHLYPIRLQRYKDFIAVNYNRWRICRPAVLFGNEKGTRVYQFLKEPLIRRFGQEWYEELCEVAVEYAKFKGKLNK